MTAPSGRVLQDGRFLLLEALGRGGMARVFRAYDRFEQRMVALKVPLGTRSAGPAHPLSVEFELWSRLRHPNVVRVRELGTACDGPIPGGAPYLVLEHVCGDRLDRVLRPGGEAPEVIAHVAAKLLHALGHVHDSGLVHRDVKPANVLLQVATRDRCEPKLTDFGLATERGAREPWGRISGSLPFVAPEALLGRPADGRADLYGLGILLFQLATGALPIRTRSVDELIRWHLAGAPADPRRIRPALPQRLSGFIAELTEREPGKRPADWTEALERLGRPAAVRSARPIGTARRRLRTRLRLALDAARLGARCVVCLPRLRGAGEELARQVGVWSQVHGLLFQRLARPRPGRPTPLARLVLRLALDRSDGPDLLPETAARWLGLGLFAGLPLWAPRAAGASAGDAARRAAARELCRFILDRSSRRSLAIHVRRGALTEPLARAVVRELATRFERPAPDTRRGGLLLLLDEALSPAIRRDSSVRG